MSGRPTHRPQRVAELLHQEVSRILQAEAKDPRVAGLTVTRVRISADLRHAKVYFTVGAGRVSPADVEDGLHHAQGFVQRLVGLRLRLKHTPALQFVRDEELERAERLMASMADLAPSPAGAEEEQGGAVAGGGDESSRDE